MSRHLHIDPFSGIAGDMFLGALVDLGADPDAVRAALSRLPIERPYEITTRRVYRHGIGAVDLKVELLDGGGGPEEQPRAAEAAPADVQGHHKHELNHDRDHTHRHGHGHHHHTGYREIMAMVDQAPGNDPARQASAPGAS